MLDIFLFEARLDLFDGDGGGASAGGETGQPATDTKGDLSKVVYGTDSSSEPDTTKEDVADPQEQTLEQRTKAYKDFIKANKDIHDSENQKIFNKRFKDYKDLQKSNERQSGILSRLSAKYKTAEGDLDALENAIDSDYSLWEDAADEAGMSVEQYKEFQKLERQNKQLIETENQRKRQAEADAQVQKWVEEEKKLQETFPDFSLGRELENPDFARLLQSGIPVDHAYKLTHFDELTQNMAFNVAKSTEKKVTDSIRAKGSRPIENGTRNTSAFTRKTDVHQLSKADRAEIARRVARGEKISF